MVGTLSGLLGDPFSGLQTRARAADDLFRNNVEHSRRQFEERSNHWGSLNAQHNSIGHHSRTMIRGMSLSGAIARFRKEGRSEDFINGYLEGIKARG